MPTYSPTRAEFALASYQAAAHRLHKLDKHQLRRLEARQSDALEEDGFADLADDAFDAAVDSGRITEKGIVIGAEPEVADVNRLPAAGFDIAIAHLVQDIIGVDAFGFLTGWASRILYPTSDDETAETVLVGHRTNPAPAPDVADNAAPAEQERRKVDIYTWRWRPYERRRQTIIGVGCASAFAFGFTVLGWHALAALMTLLAIAGIAVSGHYHRQFNQRIGARRNYPHTQTVIQRGRRLRARVDATDDVLSGGARFTPKTAEARR